MYSLTPYPTQATLSATQSSATPTQAVALSVRVAQSQISVTDDIEDSSAESAPPAPIIQARRPALVLHGTRKPNLAAGKKAHRCALELRTARKLYRDGFLSLLMYERLKLGIEISYRELK
jgi:hypothetical protein